PGPPIPFPCFLFSVFRSPTAALRSPTSVSCPCSPPYSGLASPASIFILLPGPLPAACRRRPLCYPPFIPPLAVVRPGTHITPPLLLMSTPTPDPTSSQITA